ncbi:protein disulfide oxidoreductase [Scandinavium goeteborgense]|uniref:Thiol-disulfide isomerase/thioredoxin n=1 Tax=Scandinavium goeteborgense TaxID=1851514 RepID=A0A4R6EHP9_SCAGO|nr:protein disulfide oxidoreductase [Scandinavium goeteborgense]QKN80453.1 protein disulfide oxidoreductase [Scandinavium goeteborgense]TDN58073.1 thiol-disulfide isomerase/thioredoxin [Scandinavium goeteborgense]
MRAKLKRWLREGVVLLLIAAAAMLVMDQFRQPTLPATFVSTPLQTLDGKPVSLAEMSQDRPLLVYVWATWCGVCRYTTPSVAKIAEEGGNVISVALRSGDDATLSNWLARKHYAMPTVNDASGQLSRSWQVQVTPTLMIISKGEVKSVTTGFTSGWGMKLRLWWAGL